MVKRWGPVGVLLPSLLLGCGGVELPPPAAHPSGGDVRVLIAEGGAELPRPQSAPLVAHRGSDVHSLSVGGPAMRFSNLRIELELPSGRQKAALNSFLARYSRYSPVVLDDGAIPEPPPNIPRSELRPKPEFNFRLIQIAPNRANSADLERRLERLGARGVAAYSSQDAIDLHDLVLRINETEPSGGVRAGLNLLSETTSIRVPQEEHTRSEGSLSNFLTAEEILHLNQLGVSSDYGAWDHRAPPNGLLLDGSGVQIAVIDEYFEPGSYDSTGYDPFTYLDTKPGSPTGYNFIQNNYDIGVGCRDGYPRHGQAVADSAAAARGNHYGVAGVAPKAQVYMYVTAENLCSGNINNYWAARAVETAVYWGADVINMSFAGWVRWGFHNQGGLQTAIINAKNQGVISVAGAGNDNRYYDRSFFGSPWCCDYPFPAAYPEVIGVGGHNSSYQKWIGSNYGPGVDVWAEGEVVLFSPQYIQSCYSNQQCAYAAFPASSIGANGTSHSSPLVAGLVALMKQISPALTKDQALQTLRSTSWQYNFNGHTAHVVRAMGALYAMGAYY